MSPAIPSVVVLSGAGISAESGIQTFRGDSGLWNEHRIEDVATPEGFLRNPSLVQDFYNQRRRELLSGSVEPNPAHRALGRLVDEYPGTVTVVTQNIDNLHEKGGVSEVIHMHGELLSGLCRYCDARFPVHSDLSAAEACPSCGRTDGIRPDIVWFGEMPYRMEEIEGFLDVCGIFIAIGTSGNVYPAAGFVRHAASVGARTIEVNLEPSRIENDFSEHRHGRAGDLVPVLVGELLEPLRN